MNKQDKNILSVSIIKTVIHIEVPGPTNITHQLKSAKKMKDMSQFTHQTNCWKWNKEQTKCSQDMPINITIAIIKPLFTFSILKIMVSEVAGWSRKVSILSQNYSFHFLGIDYEGAEEPSTWDAIHVVKTNIDANQKAKYKLNSSVFLMMQTTNAAQGAADIAGNVARLKEDYVAIDPKMDAAAFHLKTIGRLIEQNEGEIRSEMHGIFINKTK